jgi:hypothetical protein
MIKKYLSAFLTAIMICFIIPAFPAAEAAAANPATDMISLMATGNMIVGNSPNLLAESTDYGLSGTIPGVGDFTYESGVLTLTNFTYSTSYKKAFDLSRHTSPLEIRLVGTNSFTSTFSGEDNSVGILLGGDVTFTGEGTLTVTAGAAGEYGSFGITENSYETVTVTDTTVTVIGGDAATSYGITVDNLTVNSGGVFIARAGNGTATNAGCYVWTDLTVASGGRLEAYAEEGTNGRGLWRISGGSTSLLGEVIAKGSQYGYSGPNLNLSAIEDRVVFSGNTSAMNNTIDITPIAGTHEVLVSSAYQNGAGKAPVTGETALSDKYIEIVKSASPPAATDDEEDEATDEQSVAPEEAATVPEKLPPSYTNIAPPIRTFTLPERPNIAPKNPYIKGGVKNDGNVLFTKNGVSAEIVKAPGRRYITVIAGVNENATVNGEVTAAALWQAARLARTQGYEYIDLYIPKKSIGISAKNTEKFYIAVDGVYVVIRYYEEEISGEKLVPLTEDLGQLLT